MLAFKQVSKRFGAQEVLREAGFHVNDGERVGFVGLNGSGKSTVFALVCGDITPDAGTIETPKGARLGHLRQSFDPRESKESLLEYAMNACRDLHEIEREIAELEAGFQNGDDRGEKNLAKLGELQTRFEAADGYDMKSRAEAALSGLGFDKTDFGRALNSFSGGWQMRAELARTLVAQPDVMLLDEPTNYLDIPAIEWLRRYLRGFRGSMLLVSHDRFLLNSLTSVTIEVANGKTTRYPGNYDYYARERGLRLEQELAAYRNQEREIERVQRFIDRFRAKNTKATQVQSRIKALARMEKLAPPPRISGAVEIRLKKCENSGREVIRLENAGLTYDGARWVLRGVGLSVSRGERIALIGLNGTGKSTLLRLLGGSLAPSEGKRVLGHKAVVGYQSQDFAETMDPDCTAFETVKKAGGGAPDQDIRTLLGGLGFSGDAAEKRVGVLSGGEKVRLAFARLLVNPPNFLVLDEPTTHLDIPARESLEAALRNYNGTICMVSHDIEFVRNIATGIIAMTPPGIRRYSGGYDYYREKRDSEISAPGTREAARSAAATEQKAGRRERARLAQELERGKRRLKTELGKIERRIEALEKEQAELVKDLERGAVCGDYAAMNRRLGDLHEEIQRLTASWERAAGDLEQAGSE